MILLSLILSFLLPFTASSPAASSAAPCGAFKSVDAPQNAAAATLAAPSSSDKVPAALNSVDAAGTLPVADISASLTPRGAEQGDYAPRNVTAATATLSSRPGPTLSSRPSEASGEISRLRTSSSARDDSEASSARDDSEREGGEIDIAEIIFSHIGDSHEWHITEWKGRPVAIPLPVIVWSRDSGWHCFSSEKLDGKQYQGFFIGEDEKIFEITPDGIKRPFDISITKNVLSLMMSATLLLVLVLLSARWYRRHDVLKESPKGVAAFLEPLVMMVHTMAVENIGEDYRRYLPFLETAFFFILLNNFLGIVPFFPGGANLTGNIAVTMVLALATFFTVNLFGNKHYYKEIFLPDVPGFLKPIMPVIEVFSALMKPVSLTIRLFANMLAGHVMILSMVCVIFIMAKYGPLLGSSMTVVSVLFGVFLDALECLVAFIQAYVFTMLSSIYIGLSRQNH